MKVQPPKSLQAYCPSESPNERWAADIERTDVLPIMVDAVNIFKKASAIQYEHDLFNLIDHRP